LHARRLCPPVHRDCSSIDHDRNADHAVGIYDSLRCTRQVCAVLTDHRQPLDGLGATARDSTLATRRAVSQASLELPSPPVPR
jgi:hypothetical protein